MLLLITGFLVFFVPRNAVSGDLVRITGIVNETSQFVTDNGEIYEIAETTRGEALIEEVGVPVRVEGAIEEHDGILVIKVIDYKVMGDET